MLSPRYSLASLVSFACATLTFFVGISSGHSAEPYRPWLESSDPIALLWRKIDQGKATLDASSEKNFLLSLLQQLDIPIASQVLVFSKTSLQNNLIHPKHPRALYYNEVCYIGWVQGGMIEAIAIGPDGEPHFYTIDLPASEGKAATIGVSEQCFACHETTRTEGVKGLLVRSVFAGSNGQPLLRHGSFLTTPSSPLSERWGGWYVTGRHGNDLHMGNVIAGEQGDEVILPRESGANLTSLDHLFDTKRYLSSKSDIVALMVLEHQCAIQNLFTAAAKSTREALIRQRSMQEAFGEPLSDEPQGSALSLIQHHSQKIVKALLFADEYPLQSGGIDGDSSFQDAFRRNRREASNGRSLKDFQLHTRLFKHRCSYMIDTPSFTALPAALKKAIYYDIKLALASEPSPAGVHLSSSEREHLIKILKDTHPQAWAAE